MFSGSPVIIMSKTVAKLNFRLVYHCKIIYFDITVTTLYDPKKHDASRCVKLEARLSLSSPFR